HQIDRDTKTLTAHPEHAPVVRDIYKWAARENLGAPAIAKRLNECGIDIPNKDTAHEVHRSTHGWHQSTINRLIKNPRYVGRGIYAGAETSAYPALVDEVTFQAAQKGFARRQKERTA